ncbi:MAG: hypothetical protein JWM11_984 [Planctomycetaceae bacterium]|nr:hypothetical protein [Planctomycetaceae bacterium]
MSSFIPARELMQNYDVFGHFYTAEIASGEFVECRSVLELVNKSRTPKNHADLSSRKPDAVFIMMNPGSSQPLAPVSNHIRAEDIHEMPISLVRTKPDTTQYQVMRVMHHCQWQHVRVLNLSDLRCSKSPHFVKLYHRLEVESDFDSHSIFSAARQRELSLKLPKSRRMPLVYAWGLSEKLDPLIERCLSKIASNRTIMGILEEGTTNKYRHPLPSLQKQKLQWLDKMISLCDSSQSE